MTERAWRRLTMHAMTMALATTVVIASACSDINTDPAAVASISLDSIPYPSIVEGDSLRDSLGVARPLVATAYNIQGNPIASVPIRYRSPDLRVVVDSVTGIVVADSARPTPIRVVADAGGLQTLPENVFVVPSPDTAIAVNPQDSLLYSLIDSTKNVSPQFTVQVLHRSAPGVLDPVQAYLVSYAIAYPTAPAFAQLVGDDGVTHSQVDTTASDGSAGRRVRIDLVQLITPVDSVVILATVRYRGALLGGAPLRFVLQVKPGS